MGSCVTIRNNMTYDYLNGIGLKPTATVIASLRDELQPITREIKPDRSTHSGFLPTKPILRSPHGEDPGAERGTVTFPCPTSG